MDLKEKSKRQEILTSAHNEYGKGLGVHAFFKTHNQNTSKDLVQDTFIKTWKYLLKGGKIEMMKAFLYHVLNNLIVDEYRKKKSVSLDVLTEKGFEVAENNTENIINFLDGKVALSMISKLPKPYQKIMKMKYLEDLSLSEMSLKTGFTKNSLAVKLHRGLEKLKKIYNKKTLR
ncbi:MAG: sigma-70 family RNA polymerase sigma factor [Candidatus Paceibacterota bacterium]